MIYPITPVAKPRMTQRDKWKQRPCVMRYRAFADECRLRGVSIPADGAMVTFVVPMPKSWSERKRRAMDGKVHEQKPDLSNLVKALEDAVLKDDSAVHTMAARKVWGQSGQICIRAWEWTDPWPGVADA